MSALAASPARRRTGLWLVAAAVTGVALTVALLPGLSAPSAVDAGVRVVARPPEAAPPEAAPPDAALPDATAPRWTRRPSRLSPAPRPSLRARP
ncbi:MAG: hypothetical protein R3F60_05780 [bacterium]